MKTIINTILILLITTTSIFAQFEKAYFIDQNNNKVECYIDNKDWKNSPKKFYYKKTETSVIEIKNAFDVKEFGTYNYKYVIKEVLIDRWKDNLTSITDNSAPEFTKEICVLRQLIEGDLNLYEYENELVKKYFIETKKNEIEQLIYKKFYKVVKINDVVKRTEQILINDTYKKQLKQFVSKNCTNESDLRKLDYNKNALVKFILNSASCQGTLAKSFLKSRTFIKSNNFYLIGGLADSKIAIANKLDNQIKHNLHNEFENRFGFEFEYILPYKSKKWSVLINPIFSKYKTNFDVGNGLEYFYYQSINMHLGLRRYFKLNEKHKLFVTALSNIELEKSNLYANNGPFKKIFPILQGFSLATSAGLFLFNRIQFYYQISKRNLYNGPNWIVKYNYHSLNIGVRLF